jgi:hypothetical protein
MVPPPATVALEKSICPCAVGLASPLMSKNFDLIGTNPEREQFICAIEDTERRGLRDYFQPTLQPTVYDVLCDFRVRWQSPRSCKLL